MDKTIYLQMSIILLNKVLKGAVMWVMRELNNMDFSPTTLI
jgi:hypothetical protein